VSAVVRRTVEDDFKILREIRLAALSNEPDAYGSTLEESVRRSEDQWRDSAANWNQFLAIDDGRAVGMASGGRFPPFPEARWLYGMYVDPTHRGTGIARELVHAVADWARGEGVRTLGLHVTESIPRARAFYAKVGFTDTGLREPMVRDNELTLITMTTDLELNDRI
jgi:GNAT superfamily N-acetyltransferase